MSRFATSGSALLLGFHLSFAAAANWTFDTLKAYLPADSIRFSCTSDADTVTTRLYLETGDTTSGLDTFADLHIFTITMIDNYTGESWQENRGILDDKDQLSGSYRFDPGCPGLSPGVYLLQMSDRTGCETRKFRVNEFPQPYRTITGIVNAPEGIPKTWNSVALRSTADATTYSGWTDANGAYRIGIDQAGIERCGGTMAAEVESRFHGFIAIPARIELDLAASNWNEVNFTFVSATACLRGTTRLAGSPQPDIRVTLSDTLRSCIARSTSDADGVYAISCPPGVYLVSAGTPDSDRPLTSAETKVRIAGGDTITLNLPLSVADMAAAPRPAGQENRGHGILKMTVIDSTLTMVDKGAIMVWDGQPGRKTAARPLCIFPLQKINAGITLVEIPDRKCYLSVELSGTVLGSDCRYSVFATNKRGMRRMFDYATCSTFECTIILREKDRVQAGWGYGSVAGRVITDLQQGSTHSAVLLYDIDRATVERGCTAGSDGSFQIGNIPIGAYRLTAAIDTNNDKTPDITAMADTTLIFTGKESYTPINIAFSEKPAGTFRIAGQLSGIGAVPANVVLTVAALPVDTTAPPGARLDVAAFMKAYRTQARQGGTFVIDNLPAGTYYVVAAAEENNQETGSTRDVAFGMYGDMLLDNFDRIPVSPRAVALGDAAAPQPIVISLIMHNQRDENPLISGSKLRIPASFALQSAHIDPEGTVRIDFAVPQQTAAVFSVDNMAGRSLAALEETTFAPGFHTVTLSIDNRSSVQWSPLFVSMTCPAFRTRQAITPLQPPHPGASSAALYDVRFVSDHPQR